MKLDVPFKFGQRVYRIKLVEALHNQHRCEFCENGFIYIKSRRFSCPSCHGYYLLLNGEIWTVCPEEYHIEGVSMYQSANNIGRPTYIRYELSGLTTDVLSDLVFGSEKKAQLACTERNRAERRIGE